MCFFCSATHGRKAPTKGYTCVWCLSIWVSEYLVFELVHCPCIFSTTLASLLFLANTTVWGNLQLCVLASSSSCAYLRQLCDITFQSPSHPKRTWRQWLRQEVWLYVTETLIDKTRIEKKNQYIVCCHLCDDIRELLWWVNMCHF